VETIGTQVAGVMRDEPMTLVVVGHRNMSLEAFGRTGASGKRTPSVPEDFEEWPSPAPSCSAKRGTRSCGAWVRFSVKLATGEVELARLRIEG
jgi:hypothetical protein